MENDSKRKRLDHVALTEESIRKIQGWFDFVGTKKRGVKISRKDFVNWLIERLSDSPSSSEFNALVEKFYDEEALLRQLLREVRRTKEEGQLPQLEVVVRPRKTDIKRESAASIDEKNVQL